ncbi:hypothetical protein BMG_6160 (plasmid) [Priestia megaterium]|uniref:hypothetical protein n=1 Tax=Priestia megaterium TaxID=1404 RepID=UPI0015DC1972|nr:hypothetical protein [Priestia megaterium]QLK09385.1 hypothetical protein BMG_6160 [Priestia megaterium]
MKNHVYQNGRLLQTNKKFSALKQKQKEWITNELRQRYISAINYPYTKLRPKKRDQILNEVYDLIEEKEVWIPYGEVKRHYFSKIPSFIRKNKKMMQQEGEEAADTSQKELE